MSRLIFFDYLDFQIVEIDVFDEIVLRKPHFAAALEICNVFVQPDRPPQVELSTDFVQSAKYLVCACICAAVLNTGVLQQVIVFKGSSP